MAYIKIPRRRFRLKNYARFFAVLLVFMLVVTAIIVALGQKNETDASAAVVVTPPVLVTSDPVPPPINVPEGKSLEEVVIVLDAGHGGRDPGTIAPNQKDFHEKEVTLDIARKVEAYLVDSGITVIQARPGEDHLDDVIKQDLIKRAQVANENNASFFVSIHVNAYDLKYKGAANVNGMEVYYLDKPIMYENFTVERFASIIGDEINKATGIKLNCVKQNDYSVLRNTRMPAVLIETAYITNKDDFQRLSSEEWRDNTAKGIAEGIKLSLQEVGAFDYNGALYVFKEVGE